MINISVINERTNAKNVSKEKEIICIIFNPLFLTFAFFNFFRFYFFCSQEIARDKQNTKIMKKKIAKLPEVMARIFPFLIL